MFWKNLLRRAIGLKPIAILQEWHPTFSDDVYCPPVENPIFSDDFEIEDDRDEVFPGLTLVTIEIDSELDQGSWWEQDDDYLLQELELEE